MIRIVLLLVLLAGACDKGNHSKPVKPCVRAGCSGEKCTDLDLIDLDCLAGATACYDKARCERQASGACGWTITTEAAQCLADLRAHPPKDTDEIELYQAGSGSNGNR